MTWEFVLHNLVGYMLVFCRMGGMVFFNPFFARNSVPAMLRAGFAFALTLVIAPMVVGTAPMQMETLGLLLAMVKELMVGMTMSVVMIFFYYFLFMAGEIMDIGFGLSMAKVFDPSSNLQISISGNLFQLCAIFYFFLTNCHLILIRAVASSFGFVQIGAVVIPAALGQFMAEMFMTAFSLCMQLVMPFIAASFTLEVAMGILMKLVPQVSIFVISFQVKIILGLLLLAIYVAPITSFLQKYLTTMFSGISSLLQLFS